MINRSRKDLLNTKTGLNNLIQYYIFQKFSVHLKKSSSCRLDSKKKWLCSIALTNNILTTVGKESKTPTHLKSEHQLNNTHTFYTPNNQSLTDIV